MSDMNAVVLCGTLAAEPEHRTFESGASLVRCLVTVRTQLPRRTDVVPVTLWDPSTDVLDRLEGRGQNVWVAGMVQRRFWAGADGRHSKIEIVARAIQPHDVASAGTADLSTRQGN